MSITIPKGYKASLLGTIPIDWDVKELGELSIIKGDYGINAAAVDYDDHLPTYLRITDIDDDGNFISEGKKSVNDDNSKKFTLDDNDIVFARTGATVGKTYLHNRIKNGKLVFAGFLIRFKTNSDMLLPFYLKSFADTKIYWDWVKTVSMRSGQPGINSTEYCRLKIPLPSIPEQKAIASVLSLIDENINKTNQLISKKELQKKALMQQLLTGKKRLSGFSETWSLQKINTVATEVSIKNSDDQSIIVLSCTKYDGLVPSLEYFGRKIYSDDLTTYKIVPINHFAYATNHIEEGSIGYQNSYHFALISPMYTVFQTNDGIDDDYLLKLLKSHNYIHEYQKRMEGSIDRRGGLRWDEFSKIKIPVPSLKEQAAISKVLKTADNEIQLLRTQVHKLKDQKKWMMQVLLTGKKRLKPQAI